MTTDEVLLVESDPCARGLMARGLSQQGLRVKAVAFGDQALDVLTRSRPSVVISDMEPEGADGLRLLSQLRRDPRTAEVPVLLLGKGAWARRRSQALDSGAQGFLAKPLFVQDVGVLGRLYAGHRAADRSFAGELSPTRCVALVRGLLTGGRSGRLTLQPSGGEIDFRDGQVVDARLPPLSPTRALMRLLTYDTGRYELSFGPINHQPTLAVDLHELVTSGFEHVRRWEDLGAEMLSFDSVLEVDFRALSRQLNAVSSAVWPLLRLFDGVRTVGDVLDTSGLDDVTAARVMVKLNRLGLLRPPSEHATETEGLAGEFLASFDRSAEDELLDETALNPATEPNRGTLLLTHLIDSELAADEVAPRVATRPQAAPTREPEPAAEVALENLAAIAPAEVPAALAHGYFERLVPQTLNAEARTPAVPAHQAPDPVNEPLTARELPEMNGPLASEEDRFFVPTTDALPSEGRLASELARRSPGMSLGSKVLLGSGVAALLIMLVVLGSRRSPPEVEAAAPAAAEPAEVAAAPVPQQAAAAAPEQAAAPIPDPAAPAQQAAVAVALPSPPAEALVPAADDEASKLIAAGQKAYDGGKLTQALGSFTKAVALRPEDPVGELYLGLVRYELGQLDQAVAPLEKARTLKPDNSRADVLLGAVYQELGKSDLAKQRYEEYLKVTPKGEHAGEVRTILAGLGG